MLMPKRTKYRKQMKGRLRGVAGRGYELAFGSFGLKAMEKGFLSAREIESARKAISGSTKRGGRLWIRIFPSKPITRKPLEVRMGGGKGAVDHYTAPVKTGAILFELGGVDVATAKEAFRLATAKLSIDTSFISKEEGE
jgi:large subunit ribosomal protein L16